MNSLFALLELVLPTTQPPSLLHLPWLLLILALYLALAYIVHASEGFYTYSFLNPSRGSGRVAAYVFGIAAAIVVVFIIVWVLVWLRKRFTPLGKRSRRDMAEMERRIDVEMVSAAPK
jgi:hypothetical protein